MSALDDVPEPVRAAWQRAVDAWDDPKRHDAVVAAAAQHRAFAWAVARYRERAGDAIADEQIDRLQRSAIATLLATASERREAKPSPYRSTMLVVIALVVLAIGGLLFASMLRGAQPGK